MGADSSFHTGRARALPGRRWRRRACYRASASFCTRRPTPKKSRSGGFGPERCASVAGDAPDRKSRAFGDSRIVVMRNGRVRALFDAGPFGPGSGGHSHSDTLSLIVTNGEQEVLVDSTTYSYMDPEWREVFRGTSAHNIVRIDGPRSGNFGRHFVGHRGRKRPCWN